MADLSLREIARGALGIDGQISVIGDVFGVGRIAGTGSLRSELDEILHGPFHIVTLGESYAWGQGLPGWTKYANRVRDWLAQELEPRQGNLPSTFNFAHSGAKIRLKPSDEVLPEAHGEVPRATPTILQQVDDAIKELPDKHGVDPKTVYLVLLSAGGNDVDIIDTILSLDPMVGPDWVSKWTRNSAFGSPADGPMRTLLEKILRSFPRARIIITNYPRLLSPKSDLDIMLFGLVTLGVISGPLFKWTATQLDDQIAEYYRYKLMLQSEAFASTFTEGMREVIDSIGTGRIALAEVDFDETQAMGAPNSCYFNAVALDWGGLSAQDPLFEIRKSECAKSEKNGPHCPYASVGHPNSLGAVLYAEAIQRAITSRGWPDGWRGEPLPTKEMAAHFEPDVVEGEWTGRVVATHTVSPYASVPGARVEIYRNGTLVRQVSANELFHHDSLVREVVKARRSGVERDHVVVKAEGYRSFVLLEGGWFPHPPELRPEPANI